MANYTDKLDQLWGIPELEAQQRAAIALIRAYLQEVTTASKQLRKMQLNIGGMGDMASMKANAKQIEALTNQQIKSVKALADAKLKEARAEEALGRARLNAARLQANQDKENLALQKELERQAKVNTKALTDFAKQQERLNIQLEKENNAYEQKKRLYNEQAALAKRLIFEKGKDNQETVKAISLARQYHSELMGAEAAVGQFQRQVGNYNVVGAQFNQLLRELPNVGFGARTFVMAISNNIGYFAESVIEARRETGSWGKVLGSLFTRANLIVTVINLAVTAFTMWAMNASKAADATETLVEKTDKLTDATIRYIQEANKQDRALRSQFNQGSQAQQRYIDLLTAQGASEEEIARQKTKLHNIKIDEFNNEIQKYLEVERAVMDYAKAVQRGGDSMDRTQQTLNNLMLEGLGLSREQAAEQVKNIKEVSTALAEEGKKISLDSFDFAQGILFERLQLEENLKDELNGIEVDKAEFAKKTREQSLKDAEKATKAYYKRLRDLEKERGAPALMPTLDEINKQIKEYENAGLSNRLQTALFGSEQDEKYALKVLEEQFSQGLISAEDYETQKLKIHNDFAAQRIQLEIETTKKLLANGGMLEEDRLKAISRLNDLELELAQQGNDAKLKAEDAYHKASIRAEEERANQIKSIRQQLLGVAVEFSNILTQRELENIRDSSQALEDNKQVELARIEATSKTEEEATQRKLAFEVSYAARKEELRKKEEQARRRQFYIEKAAAITGIIVDSAQKTAALQAAAEVAHASSVAAYAGIPYVGVGLGQSQGAALRASILAQIPSIQLQAGISAALIGASVLAYAEGTPEGGHKGGGAIVGEAGEAEYVKEPGKAGYWVTKPTFYPNMAAGTEVTPLHKLEAGQLDKIDSKLLNSIMLQGGGNSARTEALLLDAISELKAIKNKPQSEWVLQGNSLKEVVKAGSRVDEKLRKRIID